MREVPPVVVVQKMVCCFNLTYFFYPFPLEGVQFSENPCAPSKIPIFKINGLLISPLSENSPSSEIPPQILIVLKYTIFACNALLGPNTAQKYNKRVL